MDRERITAVAKDIRTALVRFVKIRLLVSLIVGLGTAIGYALVGVPYAWPLGLFTGVLNVVPFLAPIVALPLTEVICYWHYYDSALPVYAWANLAHPIYALIVFTVMQLIDNVVLSPLQGKSVGLHPITTILVLLVGSGLAGVVGLLLAIPLAAVIKILFREFIAPTVRQLTGTAPKQPPATVPPPLQDRPTGENENGQNDQTEKNA